MDSTAVSNQAQILHVKGHAPQCQGKKSICALTFLIFLSICSSQAKDEAKRALDDARRLAREGDYEGALAKHIWYHDHALAQEPGQAVVRLSFALADWIELGKKYPKAVETLKTIRDEKNARLLAGEASWQLFDDVRAINGYLGEKAATVSLFKQLEATNVGFASRIYEIAEDALVGAGEYALAKKYLGDPKKRLSAIRLSYEQGMEFSKGLKTIPTRGPSDNRDFTRRTFETIFTDRLIRIITVLLKTGDKAAAQEIQTEALKTLDNEQIRAAVK